MSDRAIDRTIEALLAAPRDGMAAPCDEFVAETPWSAARPETLVVCCSDGRWHEQVEEFVRDQVSERADLYAIPGGAAGFGVWSSSFDESKVTERAFRFLADRHALEAVWLVAHQDCAYYHAKYGPLDEGYIFRRQREDLDRAADMICRWYPRLIVRKVYASVKQGRVIFTTMADEWK
jgi:Putative carbonic anhydrase